MVINECMKPQLSMVVNHQRNDFYTDFNGIGMPRSRTVSSGISGGGSSNNNTSMHRSRSTGRGFAGPTSPTAMLRHRSTGKERGGSAGATTPITSNKNNKTTKSVDRMSKESLLYKKNRPRSNQNQNMMGLSSMAKLREAQEFLEWKEQRSRSTGRLRSFGSQKSTPSKSSRPTTPTRKKAKSPRNNNTSHHERRLRPTTPTRSASHHERRLRPITPTRSPRSRQMGDQRLTISTQPTPTPRNKPMTTPTKHKLRERSFDFKKQQQHEQQTLSATAPATPTAGADPAPPPASSYSDRIRMAMSRNRTSASNSGGGVDIDDHQLANHVDVTTLVMPTVDIISHRNSSNGSTGARSVVRPVFKSQLRSSGSSGSGDSVHSIPIYDPSATPKYFEPQKKKKKRNLNNNEDKKEKAEQRQANNHLRYHYEERNDHDDKEDDDLDWRPDDTKQPVETPKGEFWNFFARSASSNLDAVEKFRDVYKEEDSEETITSVELPASGATEINAKLSDLSVSTIDANNSTTIKSPRRKSPYSNNRDVATPSTTDLPHTKSQSKTAISTKVKTPKNERSKIRISVVDDPSLDGNGIPKIKSNGYEGPQSPMSDVGDDGDRYTMYFDDNDEFDEAVRQRLSTNIIDDVHDTGGERVFEKAAAAKKSPRRRLNSNVPHDAATFGDAILRSGGDCASGGIRQANKSPGQNNDDPNCCNKRSKTAKKSEQSSPRGRADRRPVTPTREQKVINKRDIVKKKGVVNMNLNHPVVMEANDGASMVRGQTGRILPKRRPTPGLALGQSRSFVDQVEEKLAELKNKRRMQEYQEQLYGISTSNSSYNSITHHQQKFLGPGQTGLAQQYAPELNAKRGKKKLGVKKLLGALTGGGREDHKHATQTMPTAIASPTNFEGGGEMMDMFHSLEEQHTKGHQHEAEGLTKQQKNVANNNAFEMRSRDDLSGRNSNFSGRVSSLFRFRRSAPRQQQNTIARASTPAVDMKVVEEEDSIGSDEDTSSGTRSSDQQKVVNKMTTYDSAMNQENLEEEIQPEPEFAVVELGEDEDTIQTHSVLVNKNDVKIRLTSPKSVDIVKSRYEESEENIPSAANSPPNDDRRLRPVREATNTSEKQSKQQAPTTPKHITDDNSIDDMQVTVSFQDQIKQLQALKKNPSYRIPQSAAYRVPRATYVR